MAGKTDSYFDNRGHVKNGNFFQISVQKYDRK